MQITEESLQRCMSIHKEYNVPDVLVHGDLWANNIFFKADGTNATDELLAIVDWQVNEVKSASLFTILLRDSTLAVQRVTYVV